MPVAKRSVEGCTLRRDFLTSGRKIPGAFSGIFLTASHLSPPYRASPCIHSSYRHPTPGHAKAGTLSPWIVPWSTRQLLPHGPFQHLGFQPSRGHRNFRHSLLPVLGLCYLQGFHPCRRRTPTDATIGLFRYGKRTDERFFSASLFTRPRDVRSFTNQCDLEVRQGRFDDDISLRPFRQ